MNQLSRAISITLCCLVIITVGCSSSDKVTNNPQPPNQATASIGPAGGTISFNSEIEFVVPAGALADTVDFTIQETTTIPAHPDSMNFVSKVFTIDPAGTNFSSACTLTIHYSQSLVGTQSEDSLQISMCHAGTWSDLATTLDTVNNVAQAEVVHLSDYSVTEYVRTAAGPGMIAMLDASAPAIEYYGKFWSNLHRLLWYIDKRGTLDPSITYTSSKGLFRFALDVKDDAAPEYYVSGHILEGPLTYYWFYTDSVAALHTDSIELPGYLWFHPDSLDTMPPSPSKIADGLHQYEVIILTWVAHSDLYMGDSLAALGTFSLVMLSHDAYRLTIPKGNRLYPADTSRFDIVSLNNSWNLNDRLQPGTNWSSDNTTFFWPTGSTEFVTRMDGDLDSLYALLTYERNNTIGNIHATYGADTADASIDWIYFSIGD